jgi:hypothetical protein
MDKRVILKRWSLRLLVIAAVLGMLTLLGFANGSKEAPSDSTRNNSVIANSAIVIDTNVTRPRGILAQEYKTAVLPPFKSQKEMGAEFGHYNKEGNMTKGRVTVRSVEDSSLLAEYGFLLHQTHPNVFPGFISYEGAWPIDLDLNIVSDRILAIEYEKTPERQPFPPQRKMGLSVTGVRNGVEYTYGMVTAKSAEDSIVLVEHGFIISFSGARQGGTGWVVYFAEWPIDLDLNTIFDHVIGVSPEMDVPTPH